jgi:hypothetical protein
MNSISRNGKTLEFSTTEELLASTLVRTFTDNPAFIRIGTDGKNLVAIECVPVMRIIGQLAQPIILPKVVDKSQGRKEPKL